MPVFLYCSWVCCGKRKTIRANKLEAFQIPSDCDRNGYFLFPLIQSIGSVDFPFLASLSYFSTETDRNGYIGKVVHRISKYSIVFSLRDTRLEKPEGDC